MVATGDDDSNLEEDVDGFDSFDGNSDANLPLEVDVLQEVVTNVRTSSEHFCFCGGASPFLSTSLGIPTLDSVVRFGTDFFLRYLFKNSFNSEQKWQLNDCRDAIQPNKGKWFHKTGFLVIAT